MNRITYCLIVIAFVGLGAIPLCEASDITKQQSMDLPAQERARTTELNEAELKRWSFASQSDGSRLSVSEPVMRWSHYDIGRYYGDLHIITTAKGKPVATVALFRWFHPTTPAYVCATALDHKQVVAKRNRMVQWQPRTSGLDWKLLPNARRPGNSESSRLVQMRQYARRFSGEVSNRPEAERNTFKKLRLLPQPIYQYSIGTADGAIFAFSEGTNPAVLLCLEADFNPKMPTWRYGIARRWSFESRMSYQNEQIWTVPSRRPHDTNSESPYYLSLIPRS